MKCFHDFPPTTPISQSALLSLMQITFKGQTPKEEISPRVTTLDEAGMILFNVHYLYFILYIFGYSAHTNDRYKEIIWFQREIILFKSEYVHLKKQITKTHF